MRFNKLNGSRAEAAGAARLLGIGWVLYVLSWVTPSPEGWIGARAFVAAISQALKWLFHPAAMSEFGLGLCLLVGWLANFSILIPITARVRVAWIIAPWLPFIGVLLLMSAPLSTRARVLSQLYFYPWAIGIACVHLAKIQRSRRLQAAAT